MIVRTAAALGLVSAAGAIAQAGSGRGEMEREGYGEYLKYVK
jgi:hypothetical protein